MYTYALVASTAVLEFLRSVNSDTDVHVHVCDAHVHVCDVYVHVCEVYVHVCDVYVHVCDVYVHVCDVYVQVQSVQMEVHISLLRKGCVRGGASTLDLNQYATKVY